MEKNSSQLKQQIDQRTDTEKEDIIDVAEQLGKVEPQQQQILSQIFERLSFMDLDYDELKIIQKLLTIQTSLKNFTQKFRAEQKKMIFNNILQKLRVRRYAENNRVLTKDDSFDGVIFIIEGKVRMFKAKGMASTNILTNLKNMINLFSQNEVIYQMSEQEQKQIKNNWGTNKLQYELDFNDDDDIYSSSQPGYFLRPIRSQSLSQNIQNNQNVSSNSNTTNTMQKSVNYDDNIMKRTLKDLESLQDPQMFFSRKTQTLAEENFYVKPFESFSCIGKISQKISSADIVALSSSQLAFLSNSDYFEVIEQHKEDFAKIIFSLKKIFFHTQTSNLFNIACHMKEIDYPQGYILFREGNDVDSIYLINSGEVRLTQKQKESDRFQQQVEETNVILRISGPGEIFGDQQIDMLGNRYAQAEVLSRNASLYMLDLNFGKYVELFFANDKLNADYGKIREEKYYRLNDIFNFSQKFDQINQMNSFGSKKKIIHKNPRIRSITNIDSSQQDTDKFRSESMISSKEEYRNQQEKGNSDYYDQDGEEYNAKNPKSQNSQFIRMIRKKYQDYQFGEEIKGFQLPMPGFTFQKTISKYVEEYLADPQLNPNNESQEPGQDSIYGVTLPKSLSQEDIMYYDQKALAKLKEGQFKFMSRYSQEQISKSQRKQKSLDVKVAHFFDEKIRNNQRYFKILVEQEKALNSNLITEQELQLYNYNINSNLRKVSFYSGSQQNKLTNDNSFPQQKRSEKPENNNNYLSQTKLDPKNRAEDSPLRKSHTQLEDPDDLATTTNNLQTPKIDSKSEIEFEGGQYMLSSNNLKIKGSLKKSNSNQSINQPATEYTPKIKLKDSIVSQKKMQIIIPDEKVNQNILPDKLGIQINNGPFQLFKDEQQMVESNSHSHFTIMTPVSGTLMKQNQFLESNLTLNSSRKVSNNLIQTPTSGLLKGNNFFVSDLPNNQNTKNTPNSLQGIGENYFLRPPPILYNQKTAF